MQNSRVTILISALFLLSCGGGDGSGGGTPPTTLPTPAPSPTPAPTASPTPTPVYDSFANPAGVFTVQLSTIRSSYVTQRGVQSGVELEYRLFGNSLGALSVKPDGGYDISYIPDQQNFSLSDLDPNLAFLSPAFRTFKKLDQALPDSRTRSDYLTIYRPDGGTTGRPFSYTTIGEWVTQTFDRKNDESQSTSLFFAGGARTPLSDMPKTGFASTIGPAFAIFAKTSGPPVASGSISFSTDFATGEVRYNLILNRTGFSSLELKGTTGLSSTPNRFSGTIADAKYSGQISGAFNGPKASEVAFTFVLRATDGEEIAGVAIGNGFR